MAAMTSSFVGSTQAFQAQVVAPRAGHVRSSNYFVTLTAILLSHSTLDALHRDQINHGSEAAIALQGKLATVMRRTVKGGGGGSKAGTAGSPSNATWYGPGKPSFSVPSLYCGCTFVTRSCVCLNTRLHLAILIMLGMHRQ